MNHATSIASTSLGFSNPLVSARLQASSRIARDLAILALLSTMGFAVWAQQAMPVAPTLDSFTPDDSDMSVWVLRAIFGNWEADAQVPMLGAAMQQLNLFALAFGTLMFTWVSIIGTLNSAQDGEVLGKRWSSTWVPLRFIFGTALMVPLTTGYSTAQHVILWLAVAGSGGGSAVWSQAMDGFAGSQVSAALQDPMHERKVQVLFKDILRAEVCLATLTEGTGQAHGITIVPGEFNIKLHYGLAGTTQRDQCGTVTTLTMGENPTPGSSQFSLRSSSGFLGSSAEVAGYAAQDAQATRGALQQLLNRQAELITAASEGPLRQAAALIAARSAEAGGAGAALNDNELRTLVSGAVSAATRQYINGIAAPTGAAINSIQGDLTGFVEDSRLAGWMMAGPTFYQMAAIRSKMNETVNALPTYGDGSLFTSSVAGGLTTKDVVTDLDAMYTRVENGFQGSTTNGFNPGDSFAKWVGELVAFDPANDSHALVQIKDKGDYMMTAGQAIAVAAYGMSKLGDGVGGSIVSGVTSVFGKFTPSGLLGSVLSELGKASIPVLYALAGAMFFAGITMSLILPTLPFLLSIGAVLGWLMAVFSAVVAAPIWLAGHLNPDGDGFAGQRAAGGYMILLETATRPLFIVLGLIGAFLILDPMCKFVAIAFSATVNSVQANSVTGLASIAVLVCLYVVVIWTVVRTSLTLTYDLAQKVYQWIGGQFAGYEKAQEFGQSAQQASAASTRTLVEVKAGLAGAMMAKRRPAAGGGGDKQGG